MIVFAGLASAHAFDASPTIRLIYILIISRSVPHSVSALVLAKHLLDCEVILGLEAEVADARAASLATHLLPRPGHMPLVLGLSRLGWLHVTFH